MEPDVHKLFRIGKKEMHDVITSILEITRGRVWIEDSHLKCSKHRKWNAEREKEFVLGIAKDFLLTKE
jgi:hypothetical protein